MGHIFSFVVLAFFLLMGKPWAVRDMKDLLLILTDGFFVSGILLLSLGGLSFVRAKGGFDMLGYSLHSISSLMKKEKGESYYSYTVRKKTGMEWLSPVRDGAVMLGLGAVFALVWQIFVL